MPDQLRRDRFAAVAAEVYEPLQRYLHRRASPDDAAEVFNDVLTVVWRRVEDVPDDAPLPYCYGIARRCLANQRRGSERRLRLVERLSGTATGVVHDPARQIDESAPELLEALTALSAAEREIVFLWAWEALEPREIAVALETTANAVSVALNRARRKLAVRLDRQSATPGGQNAAGHLAEHEPTEP